MRFFFDRSVPERLAHMVAAISSPKITVLHHDGDSRFCPSTKDIEWIQTLKADGKPEWHIVAGDGRILKNKAERKILDETGLRSFCLAPAWQNASIETVSWRFMKVWFDILKVAKSPNGRIFEVHAGSSLKIDIVT